MGLPKKWKMKDGTKIYIKDMTTSHIENCIKLIEKQVEEHNVEVWSCDLDGFNPRFYEIDLSEYGEHPLHTALVNELDKRSKFNV